MKVLCSYSEKDCLAKIREAMEKMNYELVYQKQFSENWVYCVWRKKAAKK